MTSAADHAHDHAHGHSHDNAHGAVHTHDHAAHTHAAHGHAPHAHPPAPPGFSLLRLSAQSRLLGALILIACIWAGVFWAIA
jgi:hypothetical protein